MEAPTQVMPSGDLAKRICYPQHPSSWASRGSLLLQRLWVPSLEDLGACSSAFSGSQTKTLAGPAGTGRHTPGNCGAAGIIAAAGQGGRLQDRAHSPF